MYDKAKSCIKKDTLWSHYFSCNVGVRQGDNLSPLLFALFINDFLHYISQSYKELTIRRTCYPSISNEDLVFFKLFVLLYADENDRDSQMSLYYVHEYCTKYKLNVYTSKTKIMIFSRGKVRRFPTFKYGHHIIEVMISSHHISPLICLYHLYSNYCITFIVLYFIVSYFNLSYYTIAF